MIPNLKCAWRPQPAMKDGRVVENQLSPQQILIKCPYRLIGFGGARGGGKTDGVLGKYAIKQDIYGANFNGIFFRQSMPGSDDLIERAREIYEPMGAVYHIGKTMFNFPKGGRLRFRPLENDQDAMKYQGQNLCVAVGTNVIMADGTKKPIEQIKVGDLVQTLEGGKPVTHTTTPYQAHCVKVQVLDRDGSEIGTQVHPVWHPVLSPTGVFYSVESNEIRKSQKPHISLQSQQGGDVVCIERPTHLSYEHSGLPAWVSYVKDKNNYCVKTELNTQEAQKLPAYSVPVVLHSQTVRLSQMRLHCDLAASTEFDTDDKLEPQILACDQVACKISTDSLQQFESFQLSQDLNSRGHFDDDASCAQTKKQTSRDSRGGCQCGYDLCDEHSHQSQESDQLSIQLLNDAVEQSRYMPVDGLGTIRKHNHEDLRLWVHPYTCEARNLSEGVEFGAMEVCYFGVSYVADITVKDCNHYITDTGLINKNTDAAVEEAGNYKDQWTIFKLFGALRSGKGVPSQLILTFNPGGPGHYWLREMFVKPAPLGLKTLVFKLPTGREIPYIYIPSKLKDNPLLLANDPEYLDSLHMVGSPELVRAWLEGDFEIHEGSYFPEFGQRHIIEPFAVPKHWPKYCGFDWGYNSPFCAVWGAVCSGKDDVGNEVPYPKGAIIIYREYTGKGIDNEQMAERIAELSKGEECHMVADTQIFNNMGGKSIADQHWEVFQNYKGQANWRAADKDRINGWSQLRQRLGRNGSTPMMYFFSHCKYLLDTIPGLSIDLKHPEDLDTTGNDHGADALRYLLMERQMESRYKEIKKPAAEKGVVQIGQFIKEYRKQQNITRI